MEIKKGNLYQCKKNIVNADGKSQYAFKAGNFYISLMDGTLVNEEGKNTVIINNKSVSDYFVLVLFNKEDGIDLKLELELWGIKEVFNDLSLAIAIETIQNREDFKDNLSIAKYLTVRLKYGEECLSEIMIPSSFVDTELQSEGDIQDVARLTYQTLLSTSEMNGRYHLKVIVKKVIEFHHPKILFEKDIPMVCSIDMSICECLNKCYDIVKGLNKLYPNDLVDLIITDASSLSEYTFRF